MQAKPTCAVSTAASQRTINRADHTLNIVLARIVLRGVRLLALSYCVQAIGLQRRQGSARRCRNPDTRVRVTLTGENVTGVHANSRNP